MHMRGGSEGISEARRMGNKDKCKDRQETEPSSAGAPAAEGLQPVRWSRKESACTAIAIAGSERGRELAKR